VASGNYDRNWLFAAIEFMRLKEALADLNGREVVVEEAEGVPEATEDLLDATTNALRLLFVAQ